MVTSSTLANNIHRTIPEDDDDDADDLDNDTAAPFGHTQRPGKTPLSLQTSSHSTPPSQTNSGASKKHSSKHNQTSSSKLHESFWIRNLFEGRTVIVTPTKSTLRPKVVYQEEPPKLLAKETNSHLVYNMKHPLMVLGKERNKLTVSFNRFTYYNRCYSMLIWASNTD